MAEPIAQLAKPWVSSTVGLAGTVKIEVAFGKAIVIVSPAWREPVAVVVKPTVQVPRALAASVVAAKLTAVGGGRGADHGRDADVGGGRVGAGLDGPVGGGECGRRGRW